MAMKNVFGENKKEKRRKHYDYWFYLPTGEYCNCS